MNHKVLRILIGFVTGFIASTAIGGGLALLTGVEGDRFPLEWLEGTPFRDYTIPALLLIGAVGGSSLAACTGMIRNRESGVSLSMLAGVILMGYILVEALILKQVPSGPTPIEIMFFGLGVILILLAARLWAATHRQRYEFPRDL